MAQSPQATVSGTVTDTQGAVVVGANLIALNVATGVETTATTNEAGIYALRFLPIGNYTIKVTHAGFRGYTRQGITLTTGQTLELNIKLEVGAVAETITVSASASILETRTSDVSQLVESKTIEDMPLSDRRSMNVIAITGGAVFVNYTSSGKPNFSLAGGRTQSQMFWIDGGTGQNMRLGVGQIDTDPSVESLQETKVLSNSYSAEYGGSAGGVMIATTKSGTNRFRGSAWEYLRNQKLDAPSFFAPVVGTAKQKAPLRYNLFGASIGGPIRHDKTFFFFTYEGSRRRDAGISTLTVPTELQKAGDFSQTLNAQGQVIPIYDPATTRLESGRNVRTAFLGNRIARDRLDAVALNLLPFYPVANRPPDSVSGANNFRANNVTGITRNNFVAKIDHNLGTKDRFTTRYLYNSDDNYVTSVYPNPAADPNGSQQSHQQFWYGAWTRVLTPALINETRFTYGNRINHAYTNGLGGDWPSKLGIKGVPDNAFPQFSAAGVAGLGSASQERRQFPIEQFQMVENLSYVHGKHWLKFGVEARRSRNYETNLPTGSGSFTFATTPTGLPGTAASGNGFASLLLGFPTAFAARQTQVLNRSAWYLSGFVQEDWSIARDLTLNLGLRWETDTPIYDANARMNGFDLTAINPVSKTPGVVKFAGVNNWRKAPYDTDWNNLGPRVGIAWKPGGSQKTVVRGGFGIFYAHPFDAGNPTAASLGYELSAALNSPDNGVTAPFYLRGGVPVSLTPPKLDDSFGAVAVGQAANTAVTFFETHRRAGYAMQYNLGVQREIASSMVVEARYLANLSRKLASSNIPINQIRPELLGPQAAQKDRPFPQFSNVTIISPAFGVSNYHAAVLKFEKRFARGLSVLSTYTWAKFLDNAGGGSSVLGNEGSAYSDFYNRRGDYGPSENDLRHRFTWGSLYELPFGKGRKFLGSNPLRHIVGGWSVGSVAVLQSGAPFTVNMQTNTTNAFSAGSLRADVLRNPNLPNDQRSLFRWFDTDAFRAPAAYRFGNQGINILRGDGKVNFDFSILRNFVFSETKHLQFRAELFNAFNHPNFGLPGQNLGAAGFGVVSSSDAGRRVQLGLRMVY